jgi:hypothetical protein
VKTALAAISAEEFPGVFAAQQALLSDGSDAQSGWNRGDWALDVIIDGIVGGRHPSVKSAPNKTRGKGGMK